MRFRALVLLLCLLALSGCRSSSPLAPKSAVDSALSDLGLYCGEATQLQAYRRATARVAALDTRAAGSARQLIRIMRSDPQATYLGLTMRRVVGGTVRETRECRLERTASMLARSLG